MQIQFKQNEIEAAIRGYIVKQGISLKEREVSIVFTAGRGGNGLSAEATIEEFVMPEEEPQVIEPMVPVIPSGPINRTIHLEATRIEVMKPDPEPAAPVVVSNLDSNILAPHFGTPAEILEPAEPVPTKPVSNLFG